MSTESRRKNISVIKKLTETPYEFSFEQGVRLLERSTALRVTQLNRATNKPIARYMPPSSEFVRFNSNLSLSFSSSDILNVKATIIDSKINQWKMGVNFIGLTGSSGILPYHYTETELQRSKLKDNSMYDFLNLFNHRTTSLFYQSSVKYNFPIEYERNKLSTSVKKEPDNYTQALLSLIGFGTNNITGRLYTKDESIINYAGLLTNKVRTSSGLKQILSNHFSIPVEIKEFIGQWQDLIRDVRSRISSSKSNSRNNCLGKTVMLGRKGWIVQGKINIILGPLDNAQLQKFSPDKNTLRALDEMVRLYMGIENDYDFIMRINKSDIPERVSLSSGEPVIVGWNTWLSNKTDYTSDSNKTIDIPVSSKRFR